MGFSRQEYWIGLPFTSPGDLPDSVIETWVSESCLVLSDSLRLNGLYSPGNSLCQNTGVGSQNTGVGSQNTGVGSDSFLHGIFPTQRLNPGLPHCRWILYQMSHKGSLRILEWVAYPFSRGSSWPKNKTGVSCIAGRFFTEIFQIYPIAGRFFTVWVTNHIGWLFIFYCYCLFDQLVLKGHVPLLSLIFQELSFEEGVINFFVPSVQETGTSSLIIFMMLMPTSQCRKNSLFYHIFIKFQHIWINFYFILSLFFNSQLCFFSCFQIVFYPQVFS